MSSKIIRWALLSVWNKTGIEDLGRALSGLGISMLSTGGTAKALTNAGLRVTDIATYTGFPEMMGGRVKTLHPKVHGGILGRAEVDNDIMKAAGIVSIGLVVVNLYPFKQTIAKEGFTDEDAIENIDIGGPAMIRSAAKNHDRVTVVVDPSDYAGVLAELNEGTEGPMTTQSTRRNLAERAFAHTALYDLAISGYFRSTRS